MNLYFIKLASDIVTLNNNFIKLNEQAEKFIKLNFRMVNLNANMVNVNKKSYKNLFKSTQYSRKQKTIGFVKRFKINRSV